MYTSRILICLLLSTFLSQLLCNETTTTTSTALSMNTTDSELSETPDASSITPEYESETETSPSSMDHTSPTSRNRTRTNETRNRRPGLSRSRPVGGRFPDYSRRVSVPEYPRTGFSFPRQPPDYSRTDPEYRRPPVDYPRRNPESRRPASEFSRPISDFRRPGFQQPPQLRPSPGYSRRRPEYPRPGFGTNYEQLDTEGEVFPSKNTTRVADVTADCFDDYMKVTVRFNGSFEGLVYSSGYSNDLGCNYVNGSGRSQYEFYVRLNRCGTIGRQEVTEQITPSSEKQVQEKTQYMVNTVTVQYNPLIEEEGDEHFKVTCEYTYDFWKTVTFPAVSIETNTGSPIVFTLPPPQCHMEVRHGYGRSGAAVEGPISVGSPMTLVIQMKSENTGFDILVSNCVAHNGANKRMQLIDSDGCVVDEKLMSPFRGLTSSDRSQHVILYSYLKAFRFTGSPTLYLECDVHMCHGTCPTQRCYWRHLYKRSIRSESETREGPVVSDSISLFQALEVRQDEQQDGKSHVYPMGEMYRDDDKLCLRTAGFALLIASLLLLLLVTTASSVCLCLRIRKSKLLIDPPTNQFYQDIRPMKRL